jgi:hypothetical protein
MFRRNSPLGQVAGQTMQNLTQDMVKEQIKEKMKEEMVGQMGAAVGGAAAGPIGALAGRAATSMLGFNDGTKGASKFSPLEIMEDAATMGLMVSEVADPTQRAAYMNFLADRGLNKLIDVSMEGYNYGTKKVGMYKDGAAGVCAQCGAKYAMGTAGVQCLKCGKMKVSANYNAGTNTVSPLGGRMNAQEAIKRQNMSYFD